MMEKLIGRYVLVRSHQSGVWMGTLEEITVGPQGHDVVLSEASKIWSWQGAAATSGLALGGPGEGSKICPEVGVAVVAGCCEVLLCTPTACAMVANASRWVA